MAALTDLLDKAKETRSLPSDMALAEALGLKRQSIFQWRKGTSVPSDAHIAQLCALADVDGPEYLARIHSENATSRAERALWGSVLSRLAQAAAIAVIALGSLPSPAQAAVSDDLNAQKICIMRS